MVKKIFKLHLSKIKTMKKLFILLLVFFSYASHSQFKSDTIYLNSNEKIICKILSVQNNLVFYSTNNVGAGGNVNLNTVNFYSINGKRTNKITDNVSLYATKEPLKNSVIVLDTVKIKDELIYFKNCFFKYHNQRKNGLICTITGLSVVAIGAFIPSENNNNTNIVVMGVGGITAIVGNIITINSDKWFKKLYLGVNGSGLSATYKF